MYIKRQRKSALHRLFEYLLLFQKELKKYLFVDPFNACIFAGDVIKSCV